MFDWSRYLDLAHRLAGEETEESLRSAVSRAYYAMFCCCRNWIYLQNTVADLSKAPSIHREVASYFLKGKSRRSKRIGRLLKKIRQSRNQADYENEVADLPEVAEAALQHAELIDSLLRSLVPPKE